MLAPLPVTVVTGFLGAGKTTLVNGWLGQMQPGDVAVIVNEHGAIGIDGDLLRERVRELVEITGGCVCCSNQAELVRALNELAIAEPRSRRVIIETSGAASPAGVLRALGAGARREAFALDGVVTVVDARRPQLVLELELALEQLGFADIVVLTRAGLSSSEELEKAEAFLADRNGSAVFVRADLGQIVSPPVTTLEQLLELRSANSFAVPARAVPVRAVPVRAAAIVEAPNHDTYESVSLDWSGSLDGERFSDFMEEEVARFAGRIFRIKGIIAIAGVDARLLVQGVADSVDANFTTPWGSEPRRSRLVVVGFGLDAEGLRSSFAACR